MITIPKKILKQLIVSHAALSQAEYNRNLGYNDTHPAYQAELAICEYLQKIAPAFFTECFEIQQSEELEALTIDEIIERGAKAMAKSDWKDFRSWENLRSYQRNRYLKNARAFVEDFYAYNKINRIKRVPVL